MKNIISAAFVTAILSTPALAEKTLVKPFDECQEDILLQQMVYHLDSIDMMIEEMRQNLLREYPKPKDDMKKAG